MATKKTKPKPEKLGINSKVLRSLSRICGKFRGNMPADKNEVENSNVNIGFLYFFACKRLTEVYIV